MLNFALFLTLLRLIGSITIFPFFFFFEHKYISARFFFFFAATDFFDGYIARTYNIETKKGKIMDPIAGKFLVVSTILCLISTKQCPLIFAIPLIMREITIMAMRQYAAENNFILEVSPGGKIKTGIQCIALFISIITPAGTSFFIHLRNIFLCSATFFSLHSLFDYLIVMNKKIKE